MKRLLNGVHLAFLYLALFLGAMLVIGGYLGGAAWLWMFLP